ncbi:MAG TPA: hypothetical protein VLJ59_05640 [Mycobacteriales bacterium]|nr:hypothetical protein [Mycobacteriales bacterium]
MSDPAHGPAHGWAYDPEPAAGWAAERGGEPGGPNPAGQVDEWPPSQPYRPPPSVSQRQPVHLGAVPAYPMSPVRPARRRSHRPRLGEIRWAVVLVVGLVLAGLLAGLLWVRLAPRLPYQVTGPGQAVATRPESEVFVAADGWYLVITLAIGVLAGLLAWLPRPARGWLMPAALAAGGVAGAIATKMLGELMAGPPAAQALRQVGAVVFSPVRLRATAFIMAEGFVAVLAYLIVVGFAARDDLGNPDPD